MYVCIYIYIYIYIYIQCIYIYTHAINNSLVAIYVHLLFTPAHISMNIYIYIHIYIYIIYIYYVYFTRHIDLENAIAYYKYGNVAKFIFTHNSTVHTSCMVNVNNTIVNCGFH